MEASSSAALWILLVLLLVLSALFSAAETALFSVGRTRLRQRAGEGDERAGLAERLLEDPGRIHSTILVADNIANIGAAVVATVLFLAVFRSSLAPLYAFVAMAALVLVIGEIVPKALAVRNAERIALVAARPLFALSQLLGPVIRLLSLASRIIILPLRAKVDDNAVVTEEEIRMLVQRGEEEGVIEEGEREMIHSIFELGDTVVREVMVPRIDMEVVDEKMSVADAVQVMLATGHSRMPVVRESVDNVVGVLALKDLLRPLVEGRTDAPVREFARPPYYVPESKRLDELLREMQRRKVQMAIVVDEYGGTAGLVTLEDLLEEIVGPIMDEHDVEEKLVEVLDDRVAVIDGRMRIDEVNDLLGTDLPAAEVDTIGGFVYSLLGHVPQRGERVAYDGLEITVEDVDGQRIGKVKITRPVPSAT